MSNIEKPNFTQIPNVVFDYWMPLLSAHEFTVLSCMCRKIFGWHKTSDRISTRQLERATGISRKTVIKVIDKLVDYSLVKKFKYSDQNGNQCNEYQLCVSIPEDKLYTEQEESQIENLPKPENGLYFEEKELVIENFLKEGGGKSSTPSVPATPPPIKNGQFSDVSTKKLTKNEEKVPPLVYLLHHPPGVPATPTKERPITKEKDNVKTMSFLTEKETNKKVKFLKSLNQEQRELHDKIINHKPSCGEPLKSEDVCAWFLAQKYGTCRVSMAFEVYKQDSQEKTINSMGAYMTAALKTGRTPKNVHFEINKDWAKKACAQCPQMRALEKYLSYPKGTEEVQIMYNLPHETFIDQIAAAERFLKNGW